MDIGLQRTQFSAKLKTQYVFCKTALEQVDKAAEEFTLTHADIYSRYRTLRDANVEESRVLTDRMLKLGDEAGVLKCLYSFESRWRICKLALTGSQKELEEKIGSDKVIKEYAPKALCVEELGREDAYDAWFCLSLSFFILINRH